MLRHIWGQTLSAVPLRWRSMQLGALLPQIEIGPLPADIAAFSTAAEDAGFEFLQAYEHVVGVDTSQRLQWAGPYDVTNQFHEPLVLFGYLAALTSMALVTGVLVLPQRDAVLVAKQAAEVDLLCGGRLRLGVGIGWNQVEVEALGATFADRAARCEEQISVLRALWTQDVVRLHGRWHQLDGVGILPRPVQRPIPLWMGGWAPAALDRIGRLADGWIAMARPGGGLEESWATVTEAAARAGRPAGSVGLHGTVEPGPELDDAKLRRQVERWRAAGATHVAVSGMQGGRSPAEHVEFIRRAGTALFS